jgi:hypothetical protein
MGAQKTIDFWELAVPPFARAAMWASLAPLILKLRENVPLNRGAWADGVTFHLLLSLAVMTVYSLGRIQSYFLFWPEEAKGEEFWAHATKGFYGRNLIDMAYYWGVLAFGYSLEIYQKYKSEELRSAQLEARLIESELKALREQLRPHFFVQHDEHHRGACAGAKERRGGDAHRAAEHVAANVARPEPGA